MAFFATVWAFIKVTIHAISLVYPSFLTYKALETSQLAPAHKMLSYWCTSAFIAAISALADESLGRWATWEVWKVTMLVLKVAPLLIGPSKLYDYVVRPLFSSQAETVDQLNSQAVQLLQEAQMTVREHGGQLRDRLHENVAAASEAFIDGALATGEKLIEKSERMAQTMAHIDYRGAGKTLMKQGVHKGAHLVKHGVHTGRALVNTGVELLREHTLPAPFTKQHADAQLPWVLATSKSTSTSASTTPETSTTEGTGGGAARPGLTRPHTAPTNRTLFNSSNPANPHADNSSETETSGSSGTITSYDHDMRQRITRNSRTTGT